MTTDIFSSQNGPDEFKKDMKLTFNCPECPDESK
jgi:hypothetical protein